MPKTDRQILTWILLGGAIFLCIPVMCIIGALSYLGVQLPSQV